MSILNLNPCLKLFFVILLFIALKYVIITDILIFEMGILNSLGGMEAGVQKLPSLSDRLKAVASLVCGQVAVDVGCDHAYLSIFLAKNGCRRVYATDVRNKPLSRAKINIAKYNLLDRIKLILTDGLCDVPHDVDDVIISGMGGKLIERIILKQDWLKDKDKNLILQPQTFLTELRENLCLNGYEIENEVPVVEFNKTYCVVNARYCGRPRRLSLEESVVGRLAESDNVHSVEFLRRQYKKYSKILKGLYISNSNEEKIEKYERVCKILSKWK